MSEPAFARVSMIDARAPSSAFVPMRTRAVGASPSSSAPHAQSASDPFALGFAEGARAATETFAAERANLLNLIAAANAFQPESSEELAAMIATTVERLVTELVGAMPVERSWLIDRIDRAMSCIGEADAARTLWLHPEDAALVADADLSLDVLTDAALERGALRIDCSLGWIEDSRSLHLDALRATLGIEARS